MRYRKNILILLSVILLPLVVAACSIQEKSSIVESNLLNKINHLYCNLRNQNIKSIDFKYRSSKFDDLSMQINNKELAVLISNIEFIVRWKGGTAVSIITRNIPNLINKDAKIGLDKILAGTRAEIKGLFLVIAPTLDSLIKHKSSVKISLKEDSNGMTMELNHRFAQVKEILYFDKNFRLLKTETYENNKLSALNNMQFDSYKGKYLLKEIDTKIYADIEMRTSVKIEYKETDGAIIPYNIRLDSTSGPQVIKNEIELMPIHVEI